MSGGRLKGRLPPVRDPRGQVGSVILRARPWPATTVFNASTVEMAKVLFAPHFLYVFEATSILILPPW